MTMKAPNSTQYDTSSTRQFVLRDGNKAYIADINYLSGYDASVTCPSRITALQPTDIPAAGVEVYSIPMAVEVLIANHGNLGTSYEDEIAVTINGTNYSFEVLKDNNQAITEVVTRNVDGIEVSYLRVFLKFTKLDKSGTNTVGFKLTDATNAVTDVKNVVFKLQYGPYVKCENVVNGMSVNFDSYKDNNDDLVERIGALVGRIMNIANYKDVVYKDEIVNNVRTKRQSVFLYLNNVEVPIQAFTVDADGYPTSSLFHPVGTVIDSNGKVTSITDANFSDNLASIMNKAGENTVKFVFQSSNYSYENTIKFNVVPTNLPSVPAPNTDGVYPYTTGSDNWPPKSNDANFTFSNGAYTTRQAEFNVYGTFDFIDLGITKEEVEQKLNSNDANSITGKDYIVTITNPDWNTTVNWDLTKQFKATDK